ncbi:hypothetical protein BDR04DRAFT_1130337 [Suillus decipiens]|nr:hypothetical protein BDR04DRAFT_1130337 [Suillus decipiens]
MATCGKSSFDTAMYATFRPTYPRSLYDFIFRYHERDKGSRLDRAVNLGCGTGQARVELTPFKHVMGANPSSKMVAVAQETLKKMPVSTGQYEYVQASAESLPFLKDSNVVLVIAAQAGHWFDWNKMWPEFARNGSAAFWACIDPLNSAGPYWQQPGRSIMENHLVEVPEGNEVVPSAFSDFEKHDLLSYLNTWNSLHTFRQRKSTDGENPSGKILEGIELEDGRAVEGHDEADIEWALTIIMVKRV